MRLAVMFWILTGPAVGLADVSEEKTKQEAPGVQAMLVPIPSELQKQVRLGPHRLRSDGGDPDDPSRAFVVGYVEAQRGALEAALAEKPEPADALTGHLSVANWELAAAAASPISRLLLGIELDPDRAVLSEAARSAAKHLDAAGKILETAELADEKMEEAVGIRMALIAFQETLAALADPDMAEHQKKLRSVLTSTALLLEDARPAVQAAAEMYQAYALARTGNFERARSVLKLALTPPSTETREFALMGKLLRLRLLVGGGQASAAWLLSLRVEERANTWARDAASAEQYRRALALRRLEAVMAIRKEAQERNDVDTLSWCDEQTEEIQHQVLNDRRPVSIYRLTYGVPLLVEPPIKPAWISVFGLDTASPSLVFVLDLSPAVAPTQRRELKRQVAGACRKLSPTDRFGLLVVGAGGAAVYGEGVLGPASEQRRENAEAWLLKTEPDAEMDLIAGLTKAAADEPRHLIVVSDREGNDQWGSALVALARPDALQVDLVHVRPEPSDAVREQIEAIGGRYVHVERERAEPDKPEPDAAAPGEEKEKDNAAEEEKPEVRQD